MKSIQLVITDKCNSSCKYCYMKNGNRFMDDITFLNICDDITDNEFIIDIFGGEPLLNVDMVYYILKYMKDDPRCKKTNIYSNGLLLTQDFCDEIWKYKLSSSTKMDVQYHLSFDGLWQENGYQKHLEKKELYKQLVLHPICMISPEHLNMRENYLFFLNEFEMVPNFKIVKDNIWSPNKVEEFKIELKKLLDEYVSILETTNQNCLPGFIQNYFLKTIDGLIRNVTVENCGAGRDHVAYMPNGEKFECARFGTNKTKCLYNVFRKCEKCDIYDICEKGCLYDNQLIGSPSDELCKLYHVIYEEVIKLNNRLKNNGQWQDTVMGLLKGELIDEI